MQNATPDTPPQVPDVTTSLEILLQETDSSETPFVVLTGHNMGNASLLLCIPMHTLWEISEVANERNIADRGGGNERVAQRKLDPKHAAKLATYILKGLFHSVEAKFNNNSQPLPAKFNEMQEALGRQPYLALQPITANIRDCQPGGRDLRVKQSEDGKVTVYLSQKHVLWVVDGQHRREALRLVFEFLRALLQTFKYPRGSIFPEAERGREASPEELQVWAWIYEAARTKCKVAVEVHLGLSAEQERQLFHDLNNLTKKVEASLAFQFDSSNPVNLFIKEQLIEEGLLSAGVVEKDVVNWQEDKGSISRKDLIAVNAILFLNKTNITGATTLEIATKRDYAVRFWEAVSGIPGFGDECAKRKTVAAQPVVLKAIAKLAYLFRFGRNANEQAYEKLMTELASVDFTHQNPMWRYYLQPNERDGLCPGLSTYLPKDEGGVNRDIGAFDVGEQVMRFGAKHNDIYPILGDMIRWTLKLPNRNAVDE